MKPVSVFWACLTSAAFAFLVGVILAGYATTTHVSQAEEHNPPPAGDQFDEGPVLVRQPGASPAPAPTTTVTFSERYP
ncbi:hypothetical protein QEM13_001996 [Pseudomonas putida]|nr:hypothetical protein [Pseudomonas putida]